MLVSQILKSKGDAVVGIEPEATVGEAAALMAQHNVGAVLVRTAAGEVRGILSERDLARGLAAQGSALSDARVGALMTSNVITCSPNDTTDGLMELMTQRRIRHLPVVQDGHLVGMISIGDVVKARLGELQTQAAELQAYIATG
ncbi:MAG: CBS domain-containing protein [Geminicoccaceae bacterium]|nr:MAG: CBS domain-containing protein [Geminicoccaceae bacterium]